MGQIQDTVLRDTKQAQKCRYRECEVPLQLCVSVYVCVKVGGRSRVSGARVRAVGRARNLAMDGADSFTTIRSVELLTGHLKTVQLYCCVCTSPQQQKQREQRR